MAHHPCGRRQSVAGSVLGRFNILSCVSNPWRKGGVQSGHRVQSQSRIGLSGLWPNRFTQSSASHRRAALFSARGNRRAQACARGPWSPRCCCVVGACVHRSASPPGRSAGRSLRPRRRPRPGTCCRSWRVAFALLFPITLVAAANTAAIGAEVADVVKATDRPGLEQDHGGERLADAGHRGQHAIVG